MDKRSQLEANNNNKKEDSFKNFLQYPARVYGDLRLNEEGVVEIQNMQLDIYSSVQVLVYNQTSVISRVYPLE